MTEATKPCPFGKTVHNEKKGGGMSGECCETCKWYARFEGVCCNGDSEWRADFRSGDDDCPEWEAKQE